MQEKKNIRLLAFRYPQTSRPLQCALQYKYGVIPSQRYTFILNFRLLGLSENEALLGESLATSSKTFVLKNLNFISVFQLAVFLVAVVCAVPLDGEKGETSPIVADMEGAELFHKAHKAKGYGAPKAHKAPKASYGAPKAKAPKAAYGQC